MLPNIKFRGHLQRSSGQSALAVTIISIDQTYQQGVEFDAFCLKINAEYAEKNITQLTIIETGYLKRHYQRLDTDFPSTQAADLSALELGKAWVKQQQPFLDKLHLKPKLLSWKEVMETCVDEDDKPFSYYSEKIEIDYQTDKVFRHHIDKISQKNAAKLADKYNPDNIETLSHACLKAARAYLLEESCIIFKLIPYRFTCLLYPGTGNAALRYVYRKYFGETNPIPWLRYDICPTKQINKPPLKESESRFFQASVLKTKQLKHLLTELPERERLSFIEEIHQEITTRELVYNA